MIATSVSVATSVRAMRSSSVSAVKCDRSIAVVTTPRRRMESRRTREYNHTLAAPTEQSLRHG